MLDPHPSHWYHQDVTHLSRYLLLAAAALLTGCATTNRDAIDDEALYRAQDKTFRPLGN